MKFICTADWHLRASRPRCRVDEDWYKTQKDALTQVKEAAIKNECDVIIVGDIFNSNSDTSFQCIQMVQDFAKELQEKNLRVYVLAGNHDLPFHSSENIEKSAIGILLNSENIFSVQELDPKRKEISAPNFDQKVEDKKYIFRHILCFPDLKSLPPNVNAITAKELLEETPSSEWIFTGDYHHSFHYEKNGRHVINPGCLIRQASDMKDYECGVFYIDTEKSIVDFIPIIELEKGQFIDDSYILKQEEREERIEKFVDKLKETKNISLDFIENVKVALLQNDFDSELEDVINELLEV